MTDGNPDEVELPPELETGVLEDYKVHQIELRRSAEISAGFYEKLAALNAGSMAISVSVGLVILTKQDLRQFSHGFLVLILCFWLSLFSAIVHNFFLQLGAKLDAAYSSQQFIRSTLKRLLRHSEINSGVDSNDLKKLEKELQREPLRRQGTTTKRKRWLESIATVAGFISVISFLAGYTLVVFGAVQLWL